MVDVYSINPQILPGDKLPKHTHRRLIWLLVASIIVLIAGIWWMSLPTTIEIATPPPQKRLTEVEKALLSIKPAPAATPEEIENALKSLSSKSSKPITPPTPAEIKKAFSTIQNQ